MKRILVFTVALLLMAFVLGMIRKAFVNRDSEVAVAREMVSHEKNISEEELKQYGKVVEEWTSEAQSVKEALAHVRQVLSKLSKAEDQSITKGGGSGER